METIFYILIYLTTVCYPSHSSISLTTNDAIFNNNLFQQQCSKSEAKVTTVTSIDGLLKDANDLIRSENDGIRFFPNLPDKIFKVTMKDGRMTQKEVFIVPVRQTVKKMVEKEETSIIRYQIE